MLTATRIQSLCLCTLLSISTAALGHMSHPHPHPNGGYVLYTAGYSGDVIPFTFTPPATLHRSGAALGTSSPSWITYASPSASGTLRAYVTGESESGTVLVVEADRIGGPFQVRGTTSGYSTGGDGPVASCLRRGCLYVANYGSGSASVLSLGQDGLPAQNTPAYTAQYTRDGTGPIADRQDRSYAHDVVASPDGGWVYVCDLGADQIHRLRTPTGKDKDCGKAASEKQPSAAVPSGSGPRHLAFYRDPMTSKQYAYLTSELVNTLTAFTHDPSTGELNVVGEPILSAPPGTPLGKGADTAGPQRTTAEVALSPDGAFVYVSDRGDATEDHISIFARDPHTGGIRFVKWVPSGGQNPRHFSLSADGRYAAVAHQTTGNVVILARDEHSGDLRKTGAVATEVDQVAFAGFVDASHRSHHGV